MGNNQIQGSQSAHAQISNKFTHPYLGNIQSITHPQFGQCLKKVQNFADQIMVQQKNRRLNTRIKKYSQANHIIQVKGLQVYRKDEMCAHNYDLQIFMEPYTTTLNTLIQEKIGTRTNCTQQEILEFLKQAIDALIYLQDNGFKNCHIDKESILICKQTNCIKIIDISLAQQTPYHIFIDLKNGYNQKTGKLKNFYVAPELLKQLKENNYEPFVSPKSDIFSLGMLALELACLQELDSYYDYQQYIIDYDSLIHRVSRIVYSVQLKTLLAGMLEYEPELRLGLISLQEKIYQQLNITQQSQPENRMKKSRSSSTKMLKQLLTQSRRSSLKKAINNSFHENSIDKKNIGNSLLKRKSSQSSITSMASLNPSLSIQPKLSIGKNSHKKETILRASLKNSNEKHLKGKPENLFMEEGNPSLLKDMVKKKTSKNCSNMQNQSKLSNKKSEFNNERINTDINRGGVSSYTRYGQNMQYNHHVHTEGALYSNIYPDKDNILSKLNLSKNQYSSLSYITQIRNINDKKPYNHHQPTNSFRTFQNQTKTNEFQQKQQPKYTNIHNMLNYKQQISYGSRPFFSPHPSYLQPTSFTPKMPQNSENENTQKSNSSIFKLIEQNYSSSKPQGHIQSLINITPITSEPDLQNAMKKKDRVNYTPVSNEQKKQSDYSGNKESSSNNKKSSNKKSGRVSINKKKKVQTKEFHELAPNNKQNQFSNKVPKKPSPISSKNKKQLKLNAESIALRVKNSLDVMYKTTKSITSSQEKSYNGQEYEESIVERQFNSIDEYRSANFHRKIHLESGYFYEGEVNDEQMPEGNGILYHISPQTNNKIIIYSGQWYNGLYQGSGTIYNPEFAQKSLSEGYKNASKYNLEENTVIEVKYMGQFKKGMKSGFGTTYYVNGQKFSGQMKHDKANGRGCFVDKNGLSYSSSWVNNELRENI